jgi:hypothetical protein
VLGRFTLSLSSSSRLESEGNRGRTRHSGNAFTLCSSLALHDFVLPTNVGRYRIQRPISPPLPPPPPITIIDNLSSRYRAHRNRLQPSRTRATQAAADESINPMDNLISRFRALRNRLPTPRTQATQATAAEPTSSTVGTFSSLRALRNRYQQARTQMTTNSTDTWRFFPGAPQPQLSLTEPA